MSESSTYSQTTTSWKTSFLSLIPFTKESVEAREAELELNDLEALETEKRRIKSFNERMEKGQHDSVLKELMSETDMDFHYFNRLKSFRNAKKLSRLSDTSIRKKKNLLPELNLNKISVLVKSEYSREWDKLQSDLRTIVGCHDTQTIDREDSSRCQWRGVDPTGRSIYCSNFCLIHPWQTQINIYGRSLPKRLSFCPYHSKFCIDVNSHHGNNPVKIRRINKFALCNQCYVLKMQQSPSVIQNFRVPGLKKVNSEASKLGTRRIYKKGTKDKIYLL